MTIISLIDLESRGPSADALDNGIDCLQAVWIIIVIIVIIIIINSRGGVALPGPASSPPTASRCNHGLRTSARARIPDFDSGERFNEISGAGVEAVGPGEERQSPENRPATLGCRKSPAAYF